MWNSSAVCAQCLDRTFCFKTNNPSSCCLDFCNLPRERTINHISTTSFAIHSADDYLLISRFVTHSGETFSASSRVVTVCVSRLLFLFSLCNHLLPASPPCCVMSFPTAVTRPQRFTWELPHPATMFSCQILTQPFFPSAAPWELSKRCLSSSPAATIPPCASPRLPFSLCKWFVLTVQLTQYSESH